MLDILIRGGRVLDGAGNPWFRADVGLAGGRIAALGPLGGAAASRVLPAEGCFVTPGFIDVHTHSDLYLLADPRHEAKVRQGVTTELLGQDGLSYAPASPRNLALLRRHLSGLNGSPEVAYDWGSVGEYLARFDGGAAVNVCTLVAHSAVRVEVVGWGMRPATAAERARMRALVERGMEEGAFGLSTGLTYPPGSYADTEEVVELCRGVAAHGGAYVTHMRGTDGSLPPMEEAFAISERSGARLHISHLHTKGPDYKGAAPRILALIEGARARGLEVTFDSYCYTAGSSLLWAALPEWALEGGPDATLARIGDGETRERIKREMGDAPPAFGVRVIASVGGERNRRYIGRSIPEAAALAGKHPVDFLCDLLIEEDLAASAVALEGHEEDVRRIMTHPAHMAGSDALLTPGKPNPRSYGNYPRYLGHYVREEGVLTWEEAIRKMTSLPAQMLRLPDRGLLRPGMAADLVVFDPGRVRDRATFEDPCQFPEGIRHVLVNGVPVVEEEAHTGALPGRALRHRAPAP